MNEYQSILTDLQKQLGDASTRTLGVFLNVSPMSASNYLNGEYKPGLDTINEAITRSSIVLNALYRMRDISIAPPLVVASVKEKS